MLDGEALEKAIQAVLKQLGAVNTLYLRKIAKQIKQIGELIPSNVNRLVAMSEMNADLAEITEQLRLATATSNQMIRQIYTKALRETYNDPRFAAYLSQNPDAVRPEAQQRIAQYTQAVWEQTAGRLINYSNTTVMRPAYVAAIDRAILATSTGVTSYTEAMRDTIRQLGTAGMQVQYPSGYRRRLDTAVRQNIVDGVNQISKNASRMIGEAINEQAGEEIYDAIEISAHARSAPDHEPVQGHVFMKAEYEKMQAGLASTDIDGRTFAGFRRAIGEWNCRHAPFSFSTQWSKRKWTNEQLHAFIVENNKGCEINGKHKTLYEAMQMMRNLETEVRRQKDTAVAAQAAGDMALRQECQRNINALVRQYAAIAKASGNAEKRQRMTVEGFRAVKVPPQAQKGLTSAAKESIMKAARAAGIKDAIRIPAASADVSKLTLDSKHIQDRSHGVTEAEAKSFISNAVFSVSRWGGRFENYYGLNGAAYVDTQSQIIRTAFKAAEYDEALNGIMEEAEKWMT